MKKVALFITMSVFCIAFLAGCGANQQQSVEQTQLPEVASTEIQPAAPTEEPATTSEKVELTLWTHYEAHQEMLQGLIDDYMAENPDVVITNEFVPFADVKKQLSIGVVSEELPDLVVVDNPDMAAFATMGVFADITPYMKDWDGLSQYFKGPISSCMWEGKLHGLPVGSNTLALYYNVDMLNEAGVTPPQTWDELREAAKILTKDGVYGMAISAPGNEEGTFQFLPWLLSTGATVENVGGAEGIKAFQFLTDLVNDGSMSKEVINWTQADVNKQFMAGNVAMMLNGPWQLPAIKSEAPDLNFGITLTPKDKEYSSVLGGENWAVINGDHVEATVDFLKYLAEPEILLSYISSLGYIPSRADVASDPMFTDDPYMSEFADQLQYAMPRGPSPVWPEISVALYTTLQESLTGQKTPEQAAVDAQAKIDLLIK